MRGEVLGVERRRRWSDEEKLHIVLSVDRNGETVAQVARQHDLTRQQIYTWRYELTKKGLLSGAQRTRFLPVETDSRDLRRGAEVRAVAASHEMSLVDLQLANGRCLRFSAMICVETLVRLIRAAEVA